MAFKMHCPKCAGLDYSIERDNRTFGAVAQAFELVFHCRCGKQLFGEVLLKEYERQKKEFETRGEVTDDPRATLHDDRSRRIEEGLRMRGGGASAVNAGLDDDDATTEDDEDARGSAADRRWRAKLALDDETGDDDDDTAPPSRSRVRPSRAKMPPPAAPAPVVDEDVD